MARCKISFMRKESILYKNSYEKNGSGPVSFDTCDSRAIFCGNECYGRQSRLARRMQTQVLENIWSRLLLLATSSSPQFHICSFRFKGSIYCSYYIYLDECAMLVQKLADKRNSM